MSLIILSILFLQISFTVSNYLEIETYQRPKLDKTNILNKGVWVKNTENDKSTANFLFRGNVADVDNILQGNFNPFEDANEPGSSYISSYVDRAKRSLDLILKQQKNFDCSNGECGPNSIADENASNGKSKMLSQLKPTSVFNDYPYEIALLLGNNKNMVEPTKNYSTYVINETKDIKNVSQVNGVNNTKKDFIFNITADKEKANDTKRSMKAELDDEGNLKRIDLGIGNNTYPTYEIMPSDLTVNDLGLPSKNTVDRDIFDKDDRVWHQNAPVPQLNRLHMYKNQQSKSVRPVTERGLVKVLSMLTKTFKKIMKQHNDIKEIHTQLGHVHQNFLNNIDEMTKKFKDFDIKYSNLAKFTERLKSLESKLNTKEQHYIAKERELNNNLVDLEVQQKKFLQQQRQFYNIQKLMLAQNERINSKQNSIAKTQSEISHRQNNFARILKKAKQIYVDNKYVSDSVKPISPITARTEVEIIDKNRSVEIEPVITTPKSTESVKINLFSIPPITKIKNQDQVLLNEKDEQPVDDLVYKYYFNNTFIDSLMKHFLANFINTPESGDVSNIGISKRDGPNTELKERVSTLLLPVNKSEYLENVEGKTLNRQRRSVSHSRLKRLRKKPKRSVTTGGVIKSAENIVDHRSVPIAASVVVNTDDKNALKNDPFSKMAKKFCTEIGQNLNAQILSWCVEKAKRKLKYIEMNMPPSLPTAQKVEKDAKARNVPLTIKQLTETTTTRTIASSPKTGVVSTTTPRTAASQTTTTTPGVHSVITPIIEPLRVDYSVQNAFFPDNERIEFNLKQFELIPDLEGNVYYDGSLHASDLMKHNRNSESDVNMPGIDSNSRLDVIDPDTFDTRDMRRQLLSRMKYHNMAKQRKL